MLENKINYEDEKLLVVIYKAMDIFNVIRKTYLVINNKRINLEEKKELSLLLGILDTDNEIGKKMKSLQYNYGIEVTCYPKRESEYLEIYNRYFEDFLTSRLDSNSNLADLTLKLLESAFIDELHCNRRMSLMYFKLYLKKISHSNEKSQDKVKTLQKQ